LHIEGPIAERADERKKTNKDNKRSFRQCYGGDKEIRRFSLDGNFLIASRISVIVPTSISQLVAHKVRFDEMRPSTHVVGNPYTVREIIDSEPREENGVIYYRRIVRVS
jgi:hypothetical protein